MGKQLFTEGKQFCVLTMGFFNPSLETASLKKTFMRKIYRKYLRLSLFFEKAAD